MKPIYGLPVCFPPVDTEDKGLGSMDSSNTFSVAASIMQLQLYRPFSTSSPLALPCSEDTGISPQDTHSSLSPGTGRGLGHPLPWRLPRHRDLLLVADFFFFFSPAAGAEPGVRHAPWGSSGQAWVGTAAPAPLSAGSPPEGREALHGLPSSEPSLSARRGRRVEGTRGPSVAPAFPAASPPPFGPGINSGR